ncbi:hypothetical protein BBFGKLBO_01700 [Synechococcus sp. CBW1107]|jgi:hypothetical protein|nr:hypothetical protein BBFGKLBO_01700 [Synechococcus sp. CBW1107]
MACSLLAIAACRSSNNVAATTEEPSAVSAPAVEAEDPSAAGTKIVAGEGWGQVRRGVSQSDVEAALGAPDNVREFDDAVFHDYSSHGIQVNYKKRNMHVDAIFFFNNQSVSPGFEPFDGGTDKGITWISTEEDVLAAYGAPVNDYKGDEGGVKVRRMAYSAIDFMFEDGRLVRIAVGSD